jgi:hypothetical protein
MAQVLYSAFTCVMHVSQNVMCVPLYVHSYQLHFDHFKWPRSQKSLFSMRTSHLLGIYYIYYMYIYIGILYIYYIYLYLHMYYLQTIAHSSFISFLCHIFCNVSFWAFIGKTKFDPNFEYVDWQSTDTP